MPDTDMPGYDFRHFELPRATDRLCQASCLNEAKCQAWTFVKPNTYSIHAVCWLKSRVPDKQANTCCVSGVR